MSSADDLLAAITALDTRVDGVAALLAKLNALNLDIKSQLAAAQLDQSKIDQALAITSLDAQKLDDAIAANTPV